MRSVGQHLGRGAAERRRNPGHRHRAESKTAALDTKAGGPATRAKTAQMAPAEEAHEGVRLRGYVSQAEAADAALRSFDEAAARLGVGEAFKRQQPHMKAHVVEEVRRRYPKLGPWANRDWTPIQGVYASPAARFPDPPPPDIPVLPDRYTCDATHVEVAWAVEFIGRKLEAGQSLGEIHKVWKDRVATRAWYIWRHRLANTY